MSMFYGFQGIDLSTTLNLFVKECKCHDLSIWTQLEPKWMAHIYQNIFVVSNIYTERTKTIG